MPSQWNANTVTVTHEFIRATSSFAVSLIRTNSILVFVMTIIMTVTTSIQLDAASIGALEMIHIAQIPARSAAVLFIRHIPTIILPITEPLPVNTRCSVRATDKVHIS